MIRRPLSRPGGPRLVALKLRLLDTAFERFGIRTTADLGGVWGVDAGYSLYGLDKHGAEVATVCDDDFTEPVQKRAARDDRLRLLQGNFGSAEVASRVGSVDAIIMFDILLHQVAPDWDELIGMYAENAQCLVLAGPWWNGDETVRLLDLGHDEYLDVVPMRDLHAEILEKIDDFNDRRGRPWRDVHDIWQWGITPADLIRMVEGKGFELAHFENLGKWRGLDRFDDCGFVFVRSGRLRD